MRRSPVTSRRLANGDLLGAAVIQLPGEGSADAVPTEHLVERAVYREGGDTAPYLSIVIPVYNERDSLHPLHAALHAELERMAVSHEVIFVDDGSTDGSQAVLRDICGADPAVKVIRLRRNFGQTAAFSAGFDAARGQVIVTMDADLQNDPADIPALLAEIDAGNDVVSGWRVRRQDALITRKVPSLVANWLISAVTGVRLHDYGCSLKAYRSEVIKEVRLYGEMHRFIPAIASWMGVKVSEMPVQHSPRKYGKSKYGLTRAAKVVLDLLTVKFLLSFATRPIHIFGVTGLLLFMAGTMVGLYLSTLKVLAGEPIGDRPLLLLAILLVILGIQFITMGLLSEIMIRVYYEAQDKPIYTIREIWSGDR